MSQFTHFSKKDGLEFQTDPDQHRNDGSFPIDPLHPSVIWFSDDGEGLSWRDYCATVPDASYAGASEFVHKYEFEFKEDARILKISSTREFEEFENEFQTSRGRGIRWKDVTEEYDVVLISPYRPEKTDVPWYWWDCSSGIIFRKEVCTITQIH